MSDIEIRREGRAGRITLARPAALNALNAAMARALHAALEDWRDDDAVAVVVIDAVGTRAFCAGGDLAMMHAGGRAGDFDGATAFFRDEYAMNAAIHEYPKPVVAFMQGFTMGGGVGIGCNARHRVVGETTRMAMPECGIGLVPDVGGSLLLARAPGRLGEYLGLTGHRMTPGDALYTGFADLFIPEADWPALIAALAETGETAPLDPAAHPAPPAPLAALQPGIDRLFCGESFGDIATALARDEGEFAAETRATLARNSPLSMVATVEIVHRARDAGDIRAALDQEYRFTHRALERGDFMEGIRAAIVDKDRNPHWKHRDWRDVTAAELGAMIAPADPPLDLGPPSRDA